MSPVTFERVLTDLRGREDHAGLIALTLASSDAQAATAAETLIRIGAWTTDHWRCANAVQHAMSEAPYECLRLVHALSGTRDIDDEATQTLKSMRDFMHARPDCADAFRVFVSWFTDRAGPSQGNVAVEAFALSWPDVSQGREIHLSYDNLLAWAVNNCAGVLHDHLSGPALRTMLTLANRRRPTLLVSVAELLLRSDALDTAASCDGGREDLLWPELENALQLGAEPEWLHDALSRSFHLRDKLRTAYVAAFPERPGVVRHVLALASYPLLFEAVRSWVEMSGEGPAYQVEDGRLVRPGHDDRAVGGALSALKHQVESGLLSADVLTQVARFAGQTSSTAAVRRCLQSFEHPLLSGLGVDCAAFHEALDANNPEGTVLAVHLLGRTEAESMVLTDADRRVLEELLEALLSRAPEDIALVLGEVPARVRMVPSCPTPGFAIERVGNEWCVGNERVYARFLNEFVRDDAMMLCALYFTHELVHHAQNIADKEDVTEIRRHGREDHLLRLDMAADMHAIHWVADLRRDGWDRGALHAMTLRALERFPASLHHTAPSVERKSLRLVAHTFTRLLNRDEFGWAWVSLPHAGGRATLWWSHPIEHRIRSFTVDSIVVRSLTTMARQAFDDVARGHLERTCEQLLESGKGSAR